MYVHVTLDYVKLLSFQRRTEKQVKLSLSSFSFDDSFAVSTQSLNKVPAVELK